VHVARYVSAEYPSTKQLLILLKKVRSGLDQTDEGVPHDEVKQQFEKPPDQRTRR